MAPSLAWLRKRKGRKGCWSPLLAQRAHQKGWISLVILALAEGGTPDQSYFQIGGAPSRAHVWTDPGCSLGEGTS